MICFVCDFIQNNESTQNPPDRPNSVQEETIIATVQDIVTEASHNLEKSNDCLRKTNKQKKKADNVKSVVVNVRAMLFMLHKLQMYQCYAAKLMQEMSELEHKNRKQ